jgi:hypothetical protein
MTRQQIYSAIAAIAKHLHPQYEYEAIIGEAPDDVWIHTDDMRPFAEKLADRVPCPSLFVLARSRSATLACQITLSMHDISDRFIFGWRLAPGKGYWEITATAVDTISVSDVLAALNSTIALGGSLS